MEYIRISPLVVLSEFEQETFSPRIRGRDWRWRGSHWRLPALPQGTTWAEIKDQLTIYLSYNFFLLSYSSAMKKVHDREELHRNKVWLCRWRIRLFIPRGSLVTLSGEWRNRFFTLPIPIPIAPLSSPMDNIGREDMILEECVRDGARCRHVVRQQRPATNIHYRNPFRYRNLRTVHHCNLYSTYFPLSGGKHSLIRPMIDLSLGMEEDEEEGEREEGRIDRSIWEERGVPFASWPILLSHWKSIDWARI